MIWDSFKKVASLHFEVSFNPCLKPQQLNTKTDNQASLDEIVAKMISKLDKSFKQWNDLVAKWEGRQDEMDWEWSICRGFYKR